MKQMTKKAFTLVELLVVIAILAIISVVAYQGFGGATDKAIAARKQTDVTTIEGSLQQYKVDNNHYPAVSKYDGTTNRWGYNEGERANSSNTLKVKKDGDKITAILEAKGGGKITWEKGPTTQQIGAKGTISQQTLGKKYLSKDLADPQLSTIRVGDETMLENGIGHYVYAVFKKPAPADTTWGNNNKTGNYYNIAYTVKKEESDTYITKIVGDYDEESCFDDKALCPQSLIGSEKGDTLKNSSPLEKSDTDKNGQGIPYPVADFTAVQVESK